MSDTLDGIHLEDILRIDVALEGDWNRTVVTVWNRGEEEPDFSRVAREHEEFRPSVELYFPGRWLGLHCYRREDGRNRFDEERARKWVMEVVDRLGETT